MAIKINLKNKWAAFFLLILFLIASLAGATDLWASDFQGEAIEENNQEVLIRVGLASKIASAAVRVDAGHYILKDAAANLPIASVSKGDIINFNKLGTSIQVLINGVDQASTFRGPILVEAVDKSQLNLVSFQNVQYRDNLRILNEELLTVVNVLEVEKYLYGVVGLEMGLFAPLEALKAQAVVSRSYALNLFRPLNNWDVGVNTSTQVYGGYSAETLPNGNKANQAVDETKRLVIYYQFEENKKNRPIEAYFHANAGGYTENSENVWSNPLPYIVATPSPYDRYALEYPNQDKEGWPANSYSWTVSLSKSQILDKIAQWNTKNWENNEALISVGYLEDITVNRLQREAAGDTLSGRVTQLDLVGSEGTASIHRERTRTFFGLKSNLYTLRLDSELGMINGNNFLSVITRGFELVGIGRGNNLQKVNEQQEEYYVIGANNQVVSTPKIFRQVTFEGYGHGHGLGMSQWGAMGMANAGYNYSEIIQHYYNQGKNDGQITINQYRSY